MLLGMFFRFFWFLSPTKVRVLHINAARTKDFGDELEVSKLATEFVVRTVERGGLPPSYFILGMNHWVAKRKFIRY